MRKAFFSLVLVGILLRTAIGGWEDPIRPQIPSARIPSDIAPDLQKMLRDLYDSHRSVRLKAIETLGVNAPRAGAAIPFLIGYFGLIDSSGTPPEVVQAAKTLVRIGSSSREPLWKEVVNQTSSNRLWSAKTLAAMNTLETRNLFISGLRHEDAYVFLLSRRCLAEMGREAVNPRLKTLSDEKGFVAPDGDRRWGAVWVLGKIGDKRAGEPLLRLLTDGHTPEEIRGWSAWALGQLGDARAVEPLIVLARQIPKLPGADSPKMGGGFWLKFAEGPEMLVSKDPKMVFAPAPTLPSDEHYEGLWKMSVNALTHFKDVRICPVFSDLRDHPDPEISSMANRVLKETPPCQPYLFRRRNGERKQQ